MGRTMTPYEQKLETTEAATVITVNVVSDNLEFTTVADNNGNFSIRVPSGFSYHLTTESVQTPRAYAALVTVETGVDLDIGAVFIEPTTAISGIKSRSMTTIHVGMQASQVGSPRRSWPPTRTDWNGGPPPTKWVSLPLT